MCGIVGIVGSRSVAPLLVDALKRLEYRGYDSAGIATLREGRLDRRRAQGKLVALEECLAQDPLEGTTGIGHTRWATHGVPSVGNAHPHFAAGVAVVHNGIIENFAALKAELVDEGVVFETQTDTEVVARLLGARLAAGDRPETAMRTVLARLEGAYALAVVFEDLPDTIFGARNGPPLAIGYGKQEMYLGSDAIALAPFTDDVAYLEDGDWTIVTREGAKIHAADGRPVERKRKRSAGAHFVADKGNHRHFMEKEIHEQPEVIAHTLSHYVDFSAGCTREGISTIAFDRIERLTVSACGTAYIAGLVGKYLFERFARLPVDVDTASEFRYREPPLSPAGAALFISQSGETADTLASLRYCRSEGLASEALVNVGDSSIAREADGFLPTLAGPEIGVASTKAFTCQIAVLAALALSAAVRRGTITRKEETRLVRTLSEVPRLMRDTLAASEADIRSLAQEISHYRHALYLGRGTSFPLALEGALKLKEISYIHAEGYAAGELKHGPIALIDETMPVVVIAPYDHVFSKTISNMQEVAARGGRIILITDRQGAAAATTLETMRTILLPDTDPLVTPLIFALPLQLMAYHTAVFMGTDVDQPRNLAKSVTVE
ncbi:glutamine--fructose-6-phosphate transaminase (isomerizing) [Pararhizobium mangrovi]|uniref:Glutamine--fructose-6-phosphate aminotransferase [isomerizing] n=1 Tax=Pararhizobium mangrovi TaxID=2590452 RepID=A0A506U4T3_9HYPH|nr:glutamine--fructose-6-phosphate transaminase (isomerizing) [Pararhizobium mangrovi]TPW27559.1 glutamine--fructose-6-phosphate transaminase (isomerizing) [Pararhizobium mangrovi]